MTMTTTTHVPATRKQSPYLAPLEASKRVRWEIDRDVLRGRTLDAAHTFLPDALSKASTLEFLSADERRFVGQIQGRSYANIFGLVERFIGAKVLELTEPHRLGDQYALEALVRFGDEEIKHQELFRRVEAMAAEVMPPGYRFLPDPNAVAKLVLSKPTWSVLALTCHIELFTLAHYKRSIDPEQDLSPLWKDVFLFHWKEESQHARLDELEWRREDLMLDHARRDAAVDDFIALVAAVDGILQSQAQADAGYFVARVGRPLSAEQARRVGQTFLAAYRYQYIFSGLEMTTFPKVLFELVSASQRERIEAALAGLS